MDALDVLRFQLRGSFAQILDRLHEIGDDEWGARAIRGTSRVGFIPWHAVRTIDWAVNCAAAGRPEVADEEKWRGRLAPDEALFGSGIPDAIADSIPELVDRRTVVAYAADVQESALSWLDGLSSANLETAVDLTAKSHSKPAYRRGDVWAEIEDLSGLPVWQLLARPAISHIRVHMGEVDTLLAAVRA